MLRRLPSRQREGMIALALSQLTEPAQPPAYLAAARARPRLAVDGARRLARITGGDDGAGSAREVGVAPGSPAPKSASPNVPADE